MNHEALLEIESSTFRARLNLASDLRTFLRATSDEGMVWSLVDDLVRAEERDALLERVVELAHRPADPRYENENDTALAVYTWVLSRANKEAGQVAAAAVSQAPQCWWAPRVASVLLFSEEKDANTNISSTLVEWTEALDLAGALPRPSSFDRDTVAVAGLAGFAMELGPILSAIVDVAVAKEAASPPMGLGEYFDVVHDFTTVNAEVPEEATAETSCLAA